MVSPSRRSEDDPRRFQTLEEGYNLALTLTGRLEDTLSDFVKEVPFFRVGLRTTIGTLTSAVKTFAHDAIRLNREGLAFNKTFTEHIALAGEKIKGLPGGLSTSLKSLFSFQREGLMNVSQEALFLANKMEITGQNVGGLIKLNKVLVHQGLLTKTQRAQFNQSLNSLSTRFGVSTDLLVNSMEALGENMQIFGLTGSMQTTKSLKELTAKFPALGEELSKFVGLLLTADIGELARLDILDDVGTLFAGGGATPGDILKLIESGARGAGQFGDPENIQDRVGLDIWKGLAGETGVLATALKEAIENAEPSPAQNATEKIWKDVITSLKTTFEPLAKSIGELVLPLVEGFGKVIAKLEEFKIITTALTLAVVFQTGKIILNTLSTLANTIQMQIALAGFGGGMIFGMGNLLFGGMAAMLPLLVPLLIGALVFGILASLAESTEKLATAEELRAKAELRRVSEEDKGLSRFEAVTRSLIQNFIQSQSMADSIAVATTASQIREMENLAVVFEDKIDELIGTEGGVTFT